MCILKYINILENLHISIQIATYMRPIALIDSPLNIDKDCAIIIPSGIIYVHLSRHLFSVSKHNIYIYSIKASNSYINSWESHIRTICIRSKCF